MADIRFNVSYRQLKENLQDMAYGIGKMTDGYLKEIANAGKERLEAAYGEEYLAEVGEYDGIMPVPTVRVQKTKQHSYRLSVSEDAAILEYGTGVDGPRFYEGQLPAGWAEHVPEPPPMNSGRKNYWYFEVPPGLEPDSTWDWVKYRVQAARPPRPTKVLGERSNDKRNPLFKAWAEYDKYRANPKYTFIQSERFGVAYGHPPANGIPKAWETMNEAAREAAKHFYLRKYR